MGRAGAYLRWVATMLRAPVSRRKQWVKEIMDGFRSYRSKKSLDKTVPFLSDMLESEFDIVGFVPKMEYIKVDGPKSELEVIWEHPHMNPTLLFKHKTLPVFVVTGPGLRWNDSLLNEVGMRTEGVRGITG